MAATIQYATGKRKSAIARAWVQAGPGDIVVNEKPLEKAFPRPTLRTIIQFPLELAGAAGKYSIRATVYGGGPTGQAGALRHAISKALVVLSPAYRGPLKKEGLLTAFSCQRTEKVRSRRALASASEYSKR